MQQPTTIQPPETSAAVEAPARRATPPTAQLAIRRDRWGALHVLSEGPGARRTKLARAWHGVREIMAELEAGDADEHRAPAWETGIDWDRRKNRGVAINADIYGVDIVHGQVFGVVQVRRYERTKYGGNSRKQWLLVGRNEGTRLAFAHPVNGRAVQNAVNNAPADPSAGVTAARAWIFEVPAARLATIRRHGDVAAIPVSRLPAGERREIADAPAGLRLIDSHVLMADEIAEINGRTYARNPMLQHLAGQHADVLGHGWHRIQVGLRADVHPFARPTRD